MSAPDLRALVPAGLVQKMAAGARLLEGERKLVTVLFVDVKGSMHLAARLDDEDWHATMNGLYSVLCAAIHRYEGTVSQFTGDGVMALFGAPIAHEDHAVRACRAALDLLDAVAAFAAELRRDHDVELAVRLGLNSGEVVLGRIGDDLRLEHTAIGHTVGLAQRMEQLASAGTACLSENTARLVAARFELHDRGPQRVKGLDVPLRVYELGPLQPIGADLQARGRPAARFVGRDREFDVLRAARARADAGGGRVVGIVGDPGIGKSRLCRELLAEVGDVPVYVARGVAHGQAVPFLPVFELLRAFYGVDELCEPAVARTRIRDRLLSLGPSFGADLPLVYEFLGVGDPDQPLAVMEPEARQRQLLALVGRQVRAAGDRRFIILLEDLHWFDEASSVFLAELVHSVEHTHTLVLATFRPGFAAQWMTEPVYQQVELQALDELATSSLLLDLVGGGPSLDGLRGLIAARSEGNAFYLEELVQELVETGHLAGEPGDYRLSRPVNSDLLPATVQALLAARIDRQAESEKVVLQAAAVIGRSFSDALLREVTGLSEQELGKRLASLQSAQLMTGSQAAMERELSFKHALTQQVAYRSLLTPQRATLHARVADALQAQFSDSLDEHAALISHHWERAGDKLKAAGWGARAAGWAGFTNPLEADRHWQRVIALTGSPPPSPEAIRLALTARVMLLTFAWRQGVPEGHSIGEFERQVDRLCEEGRELARVAREPSVDTLLVALRAGFRCFSGRLEEGREQGRATIKMARSIGDVGLELALCPLPLWAAATLGRWREVDALAKHERALCQDDPTLGGGPVLTCPGAWIRVVHGLYRVYTGRPGEAQHDLRDAIRLGREHNDVEAPAWAQLWLVHAAYFLGMDPEVVLELAREAMGMADRTATTYSRGWAHCAWGLALIHAREWAAAQDALRECLSIWGPRKIGTISEPLALAYLSRAELGQGNVDDAVAIAQDAIAKAMAIGARPYEIDAQLSLAHALLAQQQPSEAIDAALSRAESLVKSTGSLTLQPQILLARADLAMVQGHPQASERALQAADALRREMGATNLERRL